MPILYSNIQLNANCELKVWTAVRQEHPTYAVNSLAGTITASLMVSANLFRSFARQKPASAKRNADMDEEWSERLRDWIGLDSTIIRTVPKSY